MLALRFLVLNKPKSNKQVLSAPVFKHSIITVLLVSFAHLACSIYFADSFSTLQTNDLNGEKSSLDPAGASISISTRRRPHSAPLPKTQKPGGNSNQRNHNNNKHKHYPTGEPTPEKPKEPTTPKKPKPEKQKTHKYRRRSKQQNNKDAKARTISWRRCSINKQNTLFLCHWVWI